MTRAILLNSGGLDSRVAAAHVKEYGWELHSLFLDYNHEDGGSALVAAQVTADTYCASHKVMPFPADWLIQKTPERYGLPYKALFVLMMGAMYANVIGAEYVVSGLRGDIGGDPSRHIQDALNELTPRNAPVILWNPLWGLPGADALMAMAGELGVDTEASKSR